MRALEAAFAQQVASGAEVTARDIAALLDSYERLGWQPGAHLKCARTAAFRLAAPCVGHARCWGVSTGLLRLIESMQRNLPVHLSLQCA